MNKRFKKIPWRKFSFERKKNAWGPNKKGAISSSRLLFAVEYWLLGNYMSAIMFTLQTWQTKGHPWIVPCATMIAFVPYLRQAALLLSTLYTCFKEWPKLNGVLHTISRLPYTYCFRKKIITTDFVSFWISTTTLHVNISTAAGMQCNR